VSKEAQRVFNAMEALEGISDPVERARVLTEVLKALPAQNRRLKQLRQTAVLELLARPGASLRSVGAELDMKHGSVQDIAKGYSGGGKRRTEADDAGPVSQPGDS
jgi:hypothetical protein